MVFIHGSGPGVYGVRQLAAVIPSLAETGFHVFAPDMVGFGYTDRPEGVEYDLETWTDQIVGFLDALDLCRSRWSETASAARWPSAWRPSTPSGSTGSC